MNKFLFLVLFSAPVFCSDNLTDDEAAINKALLQRSSAITRNIMSDLDRDRIAKQPCEICGLPSQTFHYNIGMIVSFYCLQHYPKEL